MDIETFREHCLSVKGATESLPFIHHIILVFKVMDKMFCMASIEPKDGIFWADLKCNRTFFGSTGKVYRHNGGTR